MHIKISTGQSMYQGYSVYSLPCVSPQATAMLPATIAMFQEKSRRLAARSERRGVLHRRGTMKYHAPKKAVERKPNSTMLTCAGRRRLKTRAGIPAKMSGVVSSFDMMRPRSVPTMSQTAPDIRPCRAAESGRSKRSHNDLLGEAPGSGSEECEGSRDITDMSSGAS